MADENDRVRVLAQVAFEPVAGVEVQVIGRLVEQQQAGTPQKELGQRDAHLPAARKGVGRALVVLPGKPEPGQHRRDLQVDGVALTQPESVAQLRVPIEHRRLLVV